MSIYDIDEILSFVAKNNIDISPSDRLEWVKFGCALKMLGYSEDDFVTLSSGAEKDSRKKWREERTPGRYFNNNDDKAKGMIISLAKSAHLDMKQFLLSPMKRRTEATRTPIAPRPQRVEEKATREVIYVPDLELQRYEANVADTALYSFFCRYFDEDDVRRVFAQYRVGGMEKRYMSTFPYINAEGLCVDVRLQAFTDDGHRDKKRPRAANWHLRQRNIEAHRATWPLFGEHLFSLSPNMPVGVVEAEKTALVASLTIPGYVWVATNGLYKFSERFCAALKERDCYVFPDLDGVESWRERAQNLAELGYNIRLCDEYIRENAIPGTKEDLADIILRTIND